MAAAAKSSKTAVNPGKILLIAFIIRWTTKK